MNLEVCESCFGELKIKDFINDDLKKIFSGLVIGKMPPDFDRAFLRRVLISSLEYQNFLKVARGTTH